MAETPPSRIAPVVLIVLVLIVAGVGAGLLYYFTEVKPTPAIRTVQIGDNVTVNYIGQFGSGAQIGHVFDTSILSVATNNLTYPKSLGFAWRGSDAAYTPLGVSVGPGIPSSGYTVDNITFGGVVTGFWQGMLGLPANVTKIVSIPPSLGYGPAVPACFVTLPMTTQVPTVSTVAVANFSTAYPNVTLAIGTEFLAAPYNWTAVILNVNATAVSVENLPYVGEAVSTGGLPYTVSAISSTTITLGSTLTPADAGLVEGHSTGTVCDTSTFVVSAVNPSAGTFTANYNSQVAGATLVFTITVVQFY